MEYRFKWNEKQLSNRTFAQVVLKMTKIGQVTLGITSDH